MKKFLSLLLTIAMLVSMVTIGTAVAEEKELMTITFYNDAANFHGVQTGWFAKVVKDRFNIELDIIAPQVVGDSVYATRSANGDLGDIIIMDKAKFQDVIAAGLAKDFSDTIWNYPNLAKFEEQIKTYNSSLNMGETAVYGIPDQMTDTSPTSLTTEMISSVPLIRWDLYKEVGMPELKTMDDMLDCLAAIHEIHPENELGDPAYPISLWPNWDNGDNMSGPANVVQLTPWFGEKLKGCAVLQPDNTFKKLTTKDNAYYKVTKWINTAYQRGLVDPDSGEQGWDEVCNKISAGQIDLLWYNWERGFWNSQERKDNGTAFAFIPVEEHNYYADADGYYGAARVWGLGCKVEGEKYERIMEFLDWYASPEGLTFQHCGLEGLTYTVGEDGKYIKYKDNALMDNLPVSEEYGGGGYKDGNNQINQWLCASICINPNTGETYDSNFWAATIEANKNQMSAEWTERFGSEDAVAWMKDNNKILISPNVAVAMPTDDNDIAMKRSEVNEALAKYTWQLFFCETDEAFDKLWDEMVTNLEGYGYNELYDYDCNKWQIEVDAKIEAASK